MGRQHPHDFWREAMPLATPIFEWMPSTTFEPTGAASFTKRAGRAVGDEGA